MGRTRNCTIDILRLLFAVLVVAIHTNPFAEYNAVLSYFCSQTISRLAIPFFAGVTGYFFFRDNSERKYQKYLKRFLILYTFWSILMLLNDAIHWNSSLSSFIFYALKTYFLTGWRQLWYLLAVIYIILFLTFANRISRNTNKLVFYSSFLLLACGIAADNYGRLFSNINALNWFRSFFQNSLTNWPMVLPFFMVGYALNNPYPENHKKHALPLTIICIFGLLLEILFTTLFDLHENVVLCLFTYPSIYFLLIWALNTECINHSSIARYCANMASVIYLGHSLLQYYLIVYGINPTIIFIICIFAPALIGFVLTRINSQLFSKVI